MKKLIILFITFTTVLSFSVIAQQPAIDIGEETGSLGSPVYVPITVTDFDNVGSFDFYIDFDDTNTSFIGVANTAGGIAVNSSIIAGQIYLQYAGNAIVPANGKLLDLMFTSNTIGVYSITFDMSGTYGVAGTTFIGDATTAQPVKATFTDGEVEFIAAVPLKNWAIFIGLGLIIAFLVVRFRRIV